MSRLKRKKDVAIAKSAAGAPLSTDPADAKRELSNIRPREVSLVDAAANGRKFLIVKNKDSNPEDAKLFKDENEETKPAEAAPEPKAEESKPEEPKAEEQTSEAGEGESGGGEDDYDGGEVSIEKGHFSETASKTLEEVPVSKALAMEQREMFLAMSDALMQFAFGMDMIQSDLMSFAMSDGKTGFMGEEIMKSITEQFGDDIEPKRLKVLVEKRGKKMKKARLDKLKSVMESLGSLIKELEDDESIEKGGIVVSKKTDAAQNGGTAPAVNNEAIEKEAKLKEAVEIVTKAQEEGGEAMETEEVKKALELLAEDKKEREAAADALLEKQKVDEAKAVIEKAEGKKNDDAPLTASSLSEAVDKAVEKHVKPLQEKIEKMENAPAGTSGEDADSTEDEVTKGADGKPVEKSLWSNVIY